MKLSTTVTAAVGAAAGLAVAFGAYQASSVVGESSAEMVNTSVGVPGQATPPVTETQLADCVAPARLDDDVCVTDVERTVVVYDDSGNAADDDSRSDDAYDDDSRDEAEGHESDDHYDDDHYDHDDDHDDDEEHENKEHDEDGPEAPEPQESEDD